MLLSLTLRYYRSGQRSKSYTERKNNEGPLREYKNPKESKKKKGDDSNFENKRCLKGASKRYSENNKLRNSANDRRRNSPRINNKKFGKIDEKRRYSTQSIFAVSRDHRSLSILIPDIVLNTNMGKTTKAFYSSCSEDKKVPSCEEQRRKCDQNKCMKGPANCLPRKPGKMQKDEDKMKCECETKQKSCDHTEYCSNRNLHPKGKIYVS
ncbi:hypothetical protein ACFW04_000497 [Cataglyphis niger]